MEDWFGTILAFSIFFIIAGIVLLAACIADNKYKPGRWKIGVVVFLLCVTISGLIMPIGKEEYTHEVTIQKIENRKMYFDYNGKTLWLPMDDNQMVMYELLLGKPVLLSYGKIHYLFLKPFEENEWRFFDIELIEGYNYG